MEIERFFLKKKLMKKERGPFVRQMFLIKINLVFSSVFFLLLFRLGDNSQMRRVGSRVFLLLWNDLLEWFAGIIFFFGCLLRLWHNSRSRAALLNDTGEKLFFFTIEVEENRGQRVNTRFLRFLNQLDAGLVHFRKKFLCPFLRDEHNCMANGNGKQEVIVKLFGQFFP